MDADRRATSEPDAPGVRATVDGPYVVAAGIPLVERAPTETEHGEPIAWIAGATIDPGSGYALCRCGGSASKPFCDGTHRRNGFDGSGPAGLDEPREHVGTRITVLDRRTLCVHAGFCGNRLTNVWKMVHDTDDTRVRAEVVAMIERCPSGALEYELEQVGIVEPELPVRIGVIPDGPLWASGRLPVRDADDHELPRRNRVTLCRCGASENKPYCDGTHRDIGFTDRPAR
jgi:CDGSH-type Zn-finger protein